MPTPLILLIYHNTRVSAALSSPLWLVPRLCATLSLHLCCADALIPNVVTSFVFLCHVSLCLHAAMTMAQTFTSSQCQHHLVSPYSFLPPQFICKLRYCVIQLCNTTCINLGFITDFLCNELTFSKMKCCQMFHLIFQLSVHNVAFLALFNTFKFIKDMLCSCSDPIYICSFKSSLFLLTRAIATYLRRSH